MKTVCSIKINNPAVYHGCIAHRLSILGYDTDGTYMSDFSFCPWLLAYYDGGPKVCNCSDGMYRGMLENHEFDVRTFEKVGDFIEAAAVAKLPSYSLF